MSLRNGELEPTIKRLQVSGIRVNLFIDATLEQVDAAAALGVKWSNCIPANSPMHLRKKSKGRTRAVARCRAPHRIKHASQRRSRYQLQNIKLIITSRVSPE
jgi:hypothetical protein